MQMTIDNDLAPGPSNDNGGGKPSPRSTDSFVDAALDAMAAEEEPQQKRPRKEVRRDAEADEARDEGEGEQDGVADAVDGEEGGEEEAEAPAEGAEEEHDTRGSKQEPFSVKDLPADKYIEVKVDGEKLVIPLSELPAGYIRQETFSRWANKTKLLADEAQGMVTKAKETESKVRDAVRELLGDPEGLFEYYLGTEDREKVLEAVARRYAELRRLHRERPEERLAFQRRRDEQRLAAEREHWEAQKRSEQEERQRQETLAQMRSTFQPGWEAGLRRAGFPEVTGKDGKFTPAGQALWDEVVVRCNQKQARGDRITSSDIEDFVVRAAKVLEMPARGGKKRPAPAPAAPPRATGAGAGKRQKDPWSELPQHKRVKSPDYFLQNLRSRDFR